MKAAVKEGTYFAVPLRTSGFAAGVVARASPRTGVLLAYFFDGAWREAPHIDALSGLGPRDCIRVLRIGDLGLIRGSWPIIGHHDQWRREDWTVPLFVRRDPLSRRAWSVRHPDHDVNQVEAEQPVPYEIDLEPDALYGFGAVEIALTKSLAGRQRV